MTSPVACFLLEPTDRVRVSLRRYRSGPTSRRECSGPFGYHDARAPVGEIHADVEGDRMRAPGADEYAGDSRWPAHCTCGEPFHAGDERQVFTERIYRRMDTGDELTLRDAGPGAMWDAPWYPWKGADGRSLVIVCPDGRQWSIDSRATNCTLPYDSEHRCWLRTGEPPRVTVGKSAPGQRTCGAGGGSIDTGSYHGFLVDGRFT